MVLHNIATFRKERAPHVPLVADDVVDPITVDHHTGVTVRQAITNQFFGSWLEFLFVSFRFSLGSKCLFFCDFCSRNLLFFFISNTMDGNTFVNFYWIYLDIAMQLL